MNDSESVSSSYSSSNHSASNSLNRSVITNSSLIANMSLHNTASSHSRFGLSAVEYYLPNGAIRRRAKSQILYFGDDPHTIADYNKQLIEDLILLKKQLKEKDDQIYKLNDIRNKLESEIQELSVSLFEQAYSMVNTAKAETAHSEKLLKEANGKIDVLQAEVKALKELVITSTPSTPNKHLHSHLQPSHQHRNSHSRQSSLNQQSMNSIFQQQDTNASLNNSSLHITSTPQTTHNTLSPTAQNTSHSSANHTLRASGTCEDLKSSSSHSFTISSASKASSLKPSKVSSSHNRAPSDFQPNTKSLFVKLFQSSSSSSASNSNILVPDRIQSSYSVEPQTPLLNIFEFDTVYFKELVHWREDPKLDRESEFLARIYREDILPCLCFSSKKITDDLLESIESNRVCIEELINSQQSALSVSGVCGLSNISSICQYKIKLNENAEWIYISTLSRNRVISVCDFFTYLRYIIDGLVKCNIHEIYWNIIDLRKKMSLSRLGL